MKQRSKVRLLLSIYGLVVVSMLLQSCDTGFASHPSQPRTSRIVAKKDPDKENKKHRGNLLVIDAEERTDGGCKKKGNSQIKKKRKGKQLTDRTKSIAVQSKKGKKKGKEEQVDPIVTSNRGLIKRDLGPQSVTERRDTPPIQRLQNPANIPRCNLETTSKPKAESKRVLRKSKKAKAKEELQLAKLQLQDEVGISLVEGEPLLTLDGLPVELLQSIFSNLTFKEILPTRAVNRFLYTLTTGYNSAGIVGIQNKPDSRKLVNSWYLKNPMDFRFYKKFKRGIWTHETIPSFIFYQFVEAVTSLPELYWEHLPDTHIRSFSLSIEKITSKQAKKLGVCLGKSKVRNLELWRTQLGDEGVKGISANLSQTDVEVVNLHGNHIGHKGTKVLFRSLQGKKLKEVDLSNNHIGSEGLRQICKYISSMQIESLSLTSNQIEANPIKGFIQDWEKKIGLKEISLGGNGLTGGDWDTLRARYPHIKFS